MMFWRPGEKGPANGNLYGRGSQSLQGNHDRAPSRAYDKPDTRASNHLQKYRRSILYAVEIHSTLIVVGEAEDGKSIEIPRFLHRQGWTEKGKLIAIATSGPGATQSAASYLADDMKSELGDVVGYALRFDSKLHPQRTRIKYMTYTWLLDEILTDPLLDRYAVIVIDDVDRRTLEIDLLLAALKKIQRKRDRLKVIILSNRPDVHNLRQYFSSRNSAEIASAIPVISVENKGFSVETAFAKEPVEDYVRASVDAVLESHLKDPNAGNIIVFFPSSEDIDRAKLIFSQDYRQLERRSRALMPFSLHDELSSQEVQSLLAPLDSATIRKVIFSTDICESTLMIHDVGVVIDCGFTKIRSFDIKTGLEASITTPISRASAKQRTALAARTEGGKCLRLYTEQAYNALSESPIPEISRLDLSRLVLRLKALTVDDIIHFDWLTPPPPSLMSHALENLYSVGALDDAARLTKEGSIMAELTLELSMARALLSSTSTGCAEEMLTIAALTGLTVFLADGRDADHGAQMEKRKFVAEEGDAITMLNVYTAFVKSNKLAKFCSKHGLDFQALYQASQIRAELKRILDKHHLPIHSANGDTKLIRKCLIQGYYKNAARLESDGSYRCIRNSTTLWLDKNSVVHALNPHWIVYQECVESDRKYVKGVTDLGNHGPDWLYQAAPHYFSMM